jgi:hypothetical protein
MFQTKSAPMTTGSSATEVNKVYKTNDLSIFKQIAGNRVPNPQHIKRLKSSILENGMLCNPILVNEKMQVIDGQHRLIASQEAESFIYYIILKDYSLSEVHTLNLNQKNWTKKDFMDGYADMGVESYIKLREFINKNDDYSFSDCIAFCSNISGGNTTNICQTVRGGKSINRAEVFESGTWKGKDFNLAQEWANKIRMIKPYYFNYNRSVFVGTMIILLQNNNFDYNEFMHKIRLQPTALVDCSNRDQYKTLIEDIYNWRNRQKVNLRF